MQHLKVSGAVRPLSGR